MSDENTGEETAAAASDDMKRKFREALDKKNAHNRADQSSAHLDGQGAVHGSRGQAGHKREFRRKSG